MWENYVWGRGRKTVAQVTKCRGSEEGWKQGKRGKREFFFCCCCFSFTRVSLQINTIRLYNTKYEWIYIQKLMKLKIFIIPWRSISFTIFTNISSHFPIQTMHSRLCSSYFIIFYVCSKLQEAKYFCF